MLAIIAILSIVPLMLLDGFALTRLWHWFVVPLFHLHDLTLLGAIGLALTVKYVTVQYDHNEDKRDSKRRLIAALGYGTAKPLLAVAFGWLVRFFMVMP